MLAKSKINLINKYKPILSISQGKGKKQEVQNYFCKRNEKIRLISKSEYVWKEGHFFIAINSKDETFTIDESEVDLLGLDWIEEVFKCGVANHTPTFIIEEEIINGLDE